MDSGDKLLDTNGAAAETAAPQNGHQLERRGDDVIGDDQDGGKKEKVINVKSWVAFMSLIATFLAMDQMLRYAVLTTLEKRFSFSSVMNGIVVSSYDMGHVVLLVVLSWVGSKVHRPRMCAFGGFISAVSGLLWALPHFIFGSGVKAAVGGGSPGQNLTDPLADFGLCGGWEDGAGATGFSCDVTGSNLTDTIGAASSSTETWVSFIILFASQAMLGAGFAPFLTVAIAYLDDNTDPATSAIGVSIFLSCSAIGPVFGFLFGGLMTSTYVDLSDTELTPDDPEWIGAWWLGSLVLAIAMFICTLPLLAFPRHIKEKPEENQKKDVARRASYGRQASLGSTKDELSTAEKMRPMLQRRASVISDMQNISELPEKSKSLRTNMVFICVSLAMCCIQYLPSGITPFVPKFLETQFQIDAFVANIITAIITALAAGTGTFVGGYIAAEKELNPLGSAKLILVGCTLSIICFVASMFLGCHQVKIAGSPDSDFVLNATASCNVGCGCGNDLAPVCGTDNSYYYSACHAGCSDYGGMDGEGILTFTNCTCVPGLEGAGFGNVTTGWCEHNCSLVIPYAIIMFICVFCVALGGSPIMAILIRTVDQKQKSLALGVNNILTSLLSAIPGPMFYGRMIDSTCELYLPSCDGRSSCIQYSNDRFRYYLHGVTMAFLVLAVGFMLISYTKLRKMDFSHLDQPPEAANGGEAKTEESPMVEDEEKL